eukprot:TRINITY_DN10821_c0_g1_i1.p4 TRINITY_DN10821_c0_g1~~TRINITY_DN10821_c0_g1_i1.p4  ORF type:complete len:100 (-),score=8.10 TRINITY_DN10821_c0_g1_i1:2642-2941(-)
MALSELGERYMKHLVEHTASFHARNVKHSICIHHEQKVQHGARPFAVAYRILSLLWTYLDILVAVTHDMVFSQDDVKVGCDAIMTVAQSHLHPHRIPSN